MSNQERISELLEMRSDISYMLIEAENYEYEDLKMQLDQIEEELEILSTDFETNTKEN